MGFFGGLRWLLITVKHRIIPHKQIIWLVDLNEIDDKDFLLPKDIEIIRFRSKEEVDDVILNRIIEGGTDLMGSAADEILKKRFENGATLWIMIADGKVAGYKWTIVKDPLTPTYIPHTQKDIHGIGGEMFGSFRGRNLFQIFTKYKLITLKREGFSRFYSETYIWNKAAVKACLKTDYREIGIAKRFNLFGRNIVVWYDMSNKLNNPCP